MEGEYWRRIPFEIRVRAVDPRKDSGRTVNVLSFQGEQSQPTQLIELMARMRLIKSRMTLAYNVARRAVDSMREQVSTWEHTVSSQVQMSTG